MDKLTDIFMDHGTRLNLQGSLLTPDQYSNKKIL